MAETLNSQVDLVLPNTPDVGEGDIDEIYKALLKLHQAIEILVAFYDTASGLYVTLIDAQTIAGDKTFSDIVTLNGATNLNALLTIADAINIVVGSTTGTKIGTAVSQKLGFWNATPVIQPKGALQAAITNSTGGAQDGTLVSVTGTVDTASAADGVKTNDNFTDIHTLLDAIRTALVTAGLMKGSA